jgi:hypothetical protein
MVKSEIVGSNLILRIEGIDKILAFKSELTIPLKHITDIRMDEEIVQGRWRGIKLPGSNIPGILTAGTFYNEGKRVFWDIHHPQAAVVISLTHESYDELVIQVEDPKGLILDISRILKPR